ncbi:MAG: hypothetical protein IJV14_07090 [Lachnospiraceae bacterium]|nr:hypothetical protein [Lachnospiraceae bacterium]
MNDQNKQIDSSNNGSNKEKSPWTIRRILAIAAIIFLAGMYVLTLIAALISSPGAGQLFRACLGLTIAVPILLWIILWALGRFHN